MVVVVTVVTVGRELEGDDIIVSDILMYLEVHHPLVK